jgi:hypothetical protein
MEEMAQLELRHVVAGEVLELLVIMPGLLMVVMGVMVQLQPSRDLLLLMRAVAVVGLTQLLAQVQDLVGLAVAVMVVIRQQVVTQPQILVVAVAVRD